MSIGKKTMRRDWGTISQVRKGAWRIRYWAQTDAGYRRCSETVRGTRKQAGERLAQLTASHTVTTRHALPSAIAGSNGIAPTGNEW